MPKGIFCSKYLTIPLIFLFIWLLCSDLIPQEQASSQRLIGEGKILYEQGEYQGALTKFLAAKESARVSKDLSDAFFYLSLAYFATGDNASCEEYLKRLFDVDLTRVIEEAYVPSGYSEIYHRLQGSARELVAKKKAEEEKPVVKTKPGKAEQVKKKRGFPLLVVAGVLLGGGAAAALLLSKKGGGGSSTSTTPTPTVGSIQITSTPTGAKVFLDGTDTGKTTNVTLTDVSAGTHQLKLTLENFGKWEGSAQVTGGQTTNVTATLAGYTYELVTKWGNMGSGDGQFLHPAGVAVDASGNVYVSDSDNNRIQKFTSSGSFVKRWGGYGQAEGELSTPQGIAVDSSGNIYVADSGNSRIQKFTSNGGLVWVSYGFLRRGLASPSGVTVDKSQMVYASERDGGFQILDSHGDSYLACGGHPPNWGVAVNESYLYLVSFANYILKYDLEKLLDFTPNYSKWGEPGSGDGQFNSPRQVALDGFGYFYVADAGNNRIQKFAADDVFVSKWGSNGSGDGQFAFPSGIAVDSSGYVYVADTNNNRVQEFRITDQTQQAGNITFKPNLRGPIPTRSTSSRKKGPLAEKTPRKDLTKEKGRAGK
jgi:sugar lactone lactonase YvrE